MGKPYRILRVYVYTCIKHADRLNQIPLQPVTSPSITPSLCFIFWRATSTATRQFGDPKMVFYMPWYSKNKSSPPPIKKERRETNPQLQAGKTDSAPRSNFDESFSIRGLGLQTKHLPSSEHPAFILVSFPGGENKKGFWCPFPRSCGVCLFLGTKAVGWSQRKTKRTPADCWDSSSTVYTFRACRS